MKYSLQNEQPFKISTNGDFEIYHSVGLKPRMMILLVFFNFQALITISGNVDEFGIFYYFFKNYVLEPV